MYERSARGHTGLGSWTPANGPYAQNQAFDTWGNMVQRNGWGTQNSAYPVTTFVNNRMQTNPATGAAMQYDAAGNLTGDGQETFSYDATGQQSFASVSSISQYYDGDGIRAKKVEAGVATYYVRSSMQGSQVQGERSAGAWKRAYVYMNGQMLVMQESGQTRWIHQDPVTKSQRVTNSAGSVISTIDLDPWGGETNRSSNQALMSHRYTTYERDANGGDEAQARRYQSRWTRFSQPDPSDGSHDLSDPQTFNRYSYVGNDPVNFTDPIGLEGEGPWGIWGVLLNPSLGSGGRGGGIRLPPHYVVEDPRGTIEPQTSQNTVPPRSGPCNLVTPSFADLKGANPAAYNLLTATYGNNAASTYAGWGTYNQAVFLNTIGAVAAQGVNLSNARASGFYYGDSPDRAPFGVEVTGITTDDLDRAGLGESLIPGIGRRSPRSIHQGSIEATVHGNIVAFDVDLWNVKSEPRRHAEEVRFNQRNRTTTHPADVVRALNGRGVQTGVRCQ